MHALQIVQQGHLLELRDVATPEPGADEVLIRVEAAGMCHSDAHYRSGTASVARVPITPGHEIAGRIAKLGRDVPSLKVGERVALHYLVTCGQCDYCRRGLEQFCIRGQMLGKHRDGGYAEYVVAPARNAIPVAESVSSAAAAIMMCSSGTAFHALRMARMAAGDRVAIFGIGGLGMSALQLARISGAAEVFAIDIDADKRQTAERLGAHAIDPADGPVERQLRKLTGGYGVDVALEFAGRPVTQQQAVAVLAVHGRAALAGISGTPFSVDSFATVINHEATIVGVSDHLRSELVTLMGFAARGLLDLEGVITDRVPLDATIVNQRLDALARFHGQSRTVITP